jgi:hypothetical protein
MGVLQILWLKQSGPPSKIRSEAVEFIDASMKSEDVVRMAALISCGYGISMFPWSYGRLVPIFFRFRGRKILALVLKTVMQHGLPVKFSLVRSQRYPFPHAPKLVAKYKERREKVRCLCLFPPDIDLKISWKFWTRSTKAE